MRFIDIQKMAVHALGKNKIQTALTMLGIVIGVSAVIAMVSLGQGAQKLVEDQVAGMGTNVLQIQGGNGTFTGGARQGADQGQSLTEGDVEATIWRFAAGDWTPVTFSPKTTCERQPELSCWGRLWRIRYSQAVTPSIRQFAFVIFLIELSVFLPRKDNLRRGRIRMTRR
jgi:ABC-type antimicrobial peptide transport system permease subunit